ncbi:hypothetical protein M406DRAFT_355159 [Cryphonectria parasitica EP155]|uniref:EthD domain-containing protein n=1 Tax=Cryphonectria parasitica (strain ATCC 38755 / EP155) TaxID=660469 RepID=A0A9P4Y8U6_CRYP1|nr:uncharacterized protein M406DRAFT_355159 [Cryphonectria parasitica EP155]KAF3769089.1 hypothetical protein M406DRAFT_355159 [Cryphonectria parasitica EP155]
MTFSVLIFSYRKPGTTPEQFRAHYEGTHIPLVKEMGGEHFPLSHTRRYLARAEGSAEGTTERNASFPAKVLLGSQADYDYDAFAELTFTDEAHFKTFFSLTRQPENLARLHEDEDKFLDRSKISAVVVGETVSTSK